MKKFYLLIALMVCITITQAQITITASGNTFITLDTFGYPANLATVQNFSEAKINAIWDLSNMVYDSVAKTKSRKKVVSATFSSASYSTSSFYIFGGGLTYDAEIHKEANATGIEEIGEVIETEQRLSLMALTGNAKDNLTFPIQEIPYKGNAKELTYILEFGNNWTSTSERSTNFRITVSAFGLNNTPGVRKTKVVLTDSVIGWGRVKVKNFYINETHEHEVLQVKVMRASTDSFFINGSPAPKSLLDAFGLSQGQVTNSVRIRFYKKREIFPLVEVSFNDGDINSQPDKVAVHQSKQAEFALSANQLELDLTKVYPNPIVGDKIILNNNSFNQNAYQYSFVSASGQVIQSGEFQGKIISVLPISADIPKGVYFLQVTQSGKGIFTTKLIK